MVCLVSCVLCLVSCVLCLVSCVVCVVCVVSVVCVVCVVCVVSVACCLQDDAHFYFLSEMNHRPMSQTQVTGARQRRTTQCQERDKNQGVTDATKLVQQTDDWNTHPMSNCCLLETPFHFGLTKFTAQLT